MNFSKEDFDIKKSEYYHEILKEAKKVANTKSESKLKRIRTSFNITAGIRVFKELLDGIKDKNYSYEEVANIYRDCMNFADNDDERVYILNRYLYTLIDVKMLMATFYRDVRNCCVRETDPQFTQILTSETLGFVIGNINRADKTPIKAFVSAPSVNYNFARYGEANYVFKENKQEYVHNFKQQLTTYQKDCQEKISKPMTDILQNLSASDIVALHNNHSNMSRLVYQTPDRTNCNHKYFENLFSFFKYCVLYPAVSECACGILNERKISTPNEQA